MTRCDFCRARLWPWQRRSPIHPNPAHRLCAIEDLLRPTAEARLASHINLQLVKDHETHHPTQNGGRPGPRRPAGE